MSLHISGIICNLRCCECLWLIFHGPHRCCLIFLILFVKRFPKLILCKTLQRIKAIQCTKLLHMIDKFCSIIKLHPTILALMGVIFYCIIHTQFLSINILYFISQGCCKCINAWWYILNRFIITSKGTVERYTSIIISIE